MTDEQKQEVEAINKKYDEAEQKLNEKADSEAFDHLQCLLGCFLIVGSH